MIAVNPLRERPELPDLEDEGPMLTGLAKYLGEDNNSSNLSDPRQLAILENALNLEAKKLLHKKRH